MSSPWDAPPGFRTGPLAAKIERLAAEMRRLESEWLEAALRSQMPAWLVRTMDRNMRWPAKLWIRWRRLRVKVSVEADGKLIEIYLGDELRRRARSRVKNNIWAIEEQPLEASHGPA